MTPFAINLLLSFVWAALFGDFSIASLVVGFAVGYFTLWVMQPVFGESRYCGSFTRMVSLILFFFWELLVSSVQVAWDVITPMQKSQPGIIGVPMEANTDIEITVLANLVSLTPGSLSLDISDDRKTLFVHAMFIDDPELFRQTLKHGMERRVLEALR